VHRAVIKHNKMIVQLSWSNIVERDVLCCACFLSRQASRGTRCRRSCDAAAASLKTHCLRAVVLPEPGIGLPKKRAKVGRRRLPPLGSAGGRTGRPCKHGYHNQQEAEGAACACYS
jgi:hypothetical protein